MKLFVTALTLFTLFACSLNAQKAGEVLTDRTGMNVRYGDDANFLLRMEDHHFRMIFLDDKGVVRASPFARVFLRVESRVKNKNDLRLVLSPVEGTDAFGSDRFIEPPYAFGVLVILYPVAGSDEGKITIPMTRFAWNESGGDN